eukprot:TRINITY_DN36813_c0_g1_i1.p1 TRINITY_DN36813_c0_g1~~TRINITY_DN36813_c0_g1_i1.p1  ORF type:complete len:171 (-),score=34.35 TRINITY_DN36813_c0_g1_i1:27-539(-)
MEILPSETIEFIFSFLPLKNLSRLFDVSKGMRELLMKKAFKEVTLEQIMDLVHACGQSALAVFLITLPQINPNKTVCGRSILQLLSRQGRSDCVQILLKHPDLKVNQTDNWGKTALHKACEEGHENITELLLKHPGIDPNTQGSLHVTPLHVSVSEEMRHDVLMIEKRKC